VRQAKVLDGLQLTRPSSMTSTEGCRARPTITIASQPQRLPAIAKPLLAKRIVDPIRQRALADDGKLGGGGERLPTRG
jgi:hypothetical protein